MLKYLVSSLMVLITVPALSAVKSPKTPKELQEVTVMITDDSGSSGGSGVIFRSGSSQSYVLTNSHVCEGLDETGGVVATSKGKYPVEQFKRSKVHDICLIRVIADLGVSTKLAGRRPGFGEEIRVSGHPNLLPSMTTVGYSSSDLEITLLVGMEKCSEEDFTRTPGACVFFGGFPVIKNFTAMSSSAMIAPGNSGSGVFNTKGEIVGLAFAGVGRGVSHGLIVPLEHLKRFVSHEHLRLSWVSANKARRVGASSQKTRVVNNYERMDVTAMNKVVFPAIKNNQVERTIEKLDLCRKGVETCVLK